MAINAIHYLNHDSDCGPRIGGRAPKDVVVDRSLDDLQYFGTFPTQGDVEFSVFHRFDILGENQERDILNHNNKILAPSSLIFAVLQERTVRGDNQYLPFEGRGLKLVDQEADCLMDGDEAIIPYSESKIGGNAHLVRYWLQPQVDEIESDGFKLMLQIFTHGSDIIDGFPWDPGGLFVWSKDFSNPSTYRFLIEQ